MELQYSISATLVTPLVPIRIEAKSAEGETKYIMLYEIDEDTLSLLADNWKQKLMEIRALQILSKKESK